MKGNGSLNPVVAGTTFKACDLEFEFIVKDIENPLVDTAGIRASSRSCRNWNRQQDFQQDTIFKGKSG
jgi:hypothetical protein